MYFLHYIFGEGCFNTQHTQLVTALCVCCVYLPGYHCDAASSFATFATPQPWEVRKHLKPLSRNSMGGLVQIYDAATFVQLIDATFYCSIFTT